MHQSNSTTTLHPFICLRKKNIHNLLPNISESYLYINKINSSKVTTHIQRSYLTTTHLFMTVMPSQVPLMEKTGRRPLLLYGMAGMIVSSLTITVALNLQDRVPWMSYLSLVCVIGFVFGFSLGLGEFHLY